MFAFYCMTYKLHYQTSEVLLVGENFSKGWLLKKKHFQRKLRSSEQFSHRLVLTKSKCVTFKFTESSLCFMYSVSACCTYLHVARIIADYLFRYSEAEAFRYINRLLLKVFLLFGFKKKCFLLQLLFSLEKLQNFIQFHFIRF